MAPIRIPSGSYSQTTGGASTAPTASGWDYILKFILIGDSSVGKSSLLVRLTDDRFLADPDPTIGVEFGSHLIELDNGETVKVQVWDTAGSESFRSITRSYYRGAAGALLVYDITHRASFLNAKTWLDDVRNHAEEKVTVVLVGNMSDLVAAEDEKERREAETDPDAESSSSSSAAAAAIAKTNDRQRTERRRSRGKKREVSYEEAANFAEQEGMLFLETSAKTGQNVQEAFAQAAKDIHSKFSSNDQGDTFHKGSVRRGGGGTLGRGRVDDASVGRKASRIRARAGPSGGVLDLDAPNLSGISVRGVTEADEDQPYSSGYVDNTKACCIIA